VIAEALGIGVLGAAGFGAYYPNAWIFGPVTGHGPTGRRELYLTFDDGPNPVATDAVLEFLGRHDIPATFFMVGEHVRRFPEVARRVAAAGHEIGNHTDHHVKLHRLGPARIRAELVAAHHTIADVVGRAPTTFRAPHGFRNPFVGLTARELGYRVFGWTFGVWDTDLPGAAVIERRTLRRIQPGAIILLHDGDGYDPVGDRSQTAAALAGIIRGGLDQGYVFKSLVDGTAGRHDGKTAPEPAGNSLVRGERS